MRQSRLGSFIEAWVNVLIGFAINWSANMIVLPMYFDIHVSAAAAFNVGLVFTVISVTRSYVIRRAFEARLHAMSEALASRFEK